MGNIDFLCIGNAIVDVFAGVDSAFLQQHVIHKPVQHIEPEHAQRILAALGTYTLRSGGGAANAAKAAAALGSSAAFCGCTGNDKTAEYFRNELVKTGVIPILTTGKAPTGICFILNNGTETRIAASAAAALELNEDCISEQTIKSAQMLVLDGYLLDRQELVSHIFQITDKLGIPVSLDAASVFTTRNNAAIVMRYCLNYRIVLFMNADESIAFYQGSTGSSGEADNVSEAEKEQFIISRVCPVLQEIAAGDFPVIVIKLGSQGALAISRGKIYREETQAIDAGSTIGAGDTFCAGFLAAWIKDKSIGECLRQGNEAAWELIMRNKGIDRGN